MSKKAEVYQKELEIADPLVERIAEIKGKDFEYVEILHNLEFELWSSNDCGFRQWPSLQK